MQRSLKAERSLFFLIFLFQSAAGLGAGVTEVVTRYALDVGVRWWPTQNEVLL